MTYLNLASNCLGPKGAKRVAKAIKKNGALVTVNISNNYLHAAGTKVIAEALKDNAIMTELDISSNAATWDGNKHGDMSGVMDIANAIPTMRAMVKVDISKNNIRAEGGKALAKALQDNQVIQELNIAANNLGRGPKTGSTDMSGVIAIADAIPTVGALTSLNISNNMLCGKYSDGYGDAPYTVAGIKALCEMLQTNTTLLELDISKNFLGAEGSKILADGLSTNGALTSLNLSENTLCGINEYALADAIGKHQ